MTRPHDFKAQEAERLQEWSYQREGNLLPSGIRYPLYLCCPRSHHHHSWLRGGLELCTPLRQPPGYPPAARQCLFRAELGGCSQHPLSPESRSCSSRWEPACSGSSQRSAGSMRRTWSLLQPQLSCARCPRRAAAPEPHACSPE